MIIIDVPILQVYPAPAERVALKRPMLTTWSVEFQDGLFNHITHFSTVAEITKSAIVVAYGILAKKNLVFKSTELYTAYKK